MIFSSYEFLYVFLPVVLVAVWLSAVFKQERLTLFVLLLSSCVFIGWSNWTFLAFLLASAIINFAIGLAIANTAEQRLRLLILILGVGGNLFFLGYFKYAGFLSGVLLGTQVPAGPVSTGLPLGISFYTLQQIAYLVDSWRLKKPERHMDRYLLFVSFFPQLIAGPIVHHDEVREQIKPGGRYSGGAALPFISAGIALLVLGLAKKVLIADSVGPYADLAFQAAEAGHSLTLIDAWAGAFCYTFQIYFDFSGYADMAVGLGLILGIRLPRNFLSPYRARNIVEFWQRWHITLSKFLRDYLYIPLGGNRRGRARRYINIMATMLIGGIWHGAGWTFILWGLLHGALISLNHFWRGLSRKWSLPIIPAPMAWAITLICVIFGWVLFRANSLDGAKNMYTSMFGLTTNTVPLHGDYLLIGGLLALALFVVLVFPEPYDMVLNKRKVWEEKWKRVPIAVQGFVLAALLLAAILRIPYATRFIYFQF